MRLHSGEVCGNSDPRSRGHRPARESCAQGLVEPRGLTWLDGNHLQGSMNKNVLGRTGTCGLGLFLMENRMETS